MKQLIWDLPTRIFHWLLVISVVGAFCVAELADKETAAFLIHVVFGVLAGLLIIWRIIWGFVGSKHVKWNELFFAPASVLKYFNGVFSGKGSYHAGHNPGSSNVILAILLLVAATVFTGFMNSQAEAFEELHESLPIILMVFVGFHVLGVLLATKMNKENYLFGMITGYKRANVQEAIKCSYRGAAVIMLFFVFGSWAYFIKGFDRTTGLFKAPGTNWSFQVGDAEVELNSPKED
jgi:cytochrome b